MILPALALMILAGVSAYVVAKREIQPSTIAGLLALIVLGLAVAAADADSSEIRKLSFCADPANRDEVPCW